MLGTSEHPFDASVKVYAVCPHMPMFTESFYVQDDLALGTRAGSTASVSFNNLVLWHPKDIHSPPNGSVFLLVYSD